MSRDAEDSGFLTSALSRRGHDQLPYAESQKWTVRQHMIDLLKDFPSLRPSVQTYTHVNGRSVELLKAAGTLPMYHQNVKYNIPVALWLPENYPNQPPLLFVEPTPSMMISMQHPFVGPSGDVQSTYIASWDASRSNLLDMAHDTSIQFGGNPPLFAKPPGWDEAAAAAASAVTSRQAMHPHGGSADGLEEVFQQNPMIGSGGGRQRDDYYGGGGGRQQENHYSSSQGGMLQDLDSSGGSFWNGAVREAQQDHRSSSPQVKQQHQHQQPQQQRPQHDDGRRDQRHHMPAADAGGASDDLSRDFHQAAVACLSRRLHHSLVSHERQAAAETDKLLELQTELAQRGQHLKVAIEDMTRERNVLESSVLEMNTKGQAIDRWLALNESKTPSGDVDPNEAIVPADALCGQALEAQAEDMAIEDCLYALERAFQNGALDAPVYIKQVRMLCGKQFYVRALSMKIAALQHHAPPPPPAPASQPLQQSHYPGQHPSSFGGQQTAYRLETQGSAGRSVQMQIGDSWTNTGIVSNPLQAGSSA